MKNLVIANPTFYYAVITTTIVYALLTPIFFEMYNAYGERVSFVVVNYNDNTMTYAQQQIVEQVKAECKSPCSKSSDMCIIMCK